MFSKTWAQTNHAFLQHPNKTKPSCFIWNWKW